jgi:hypothetical protein
VLTSQAIERKRPPRDKADQLTSGYLHLKVVDCTQTKETTYRFGKHQKSHRENKQQRDLLGLDNLLKH